MQKTENFVSEEPLGVVAMKFGKTFEQSLLEDHLSDAWVDNAIKYKLLKKDIKTIVEEIDNKGLHEKLHTEKLHYVFHKHENELETDLFDAEDHEASLKLRSDHLFFQNLYSQSVKLSKFQNKQEQELVDSIQQFSLLIQELTENSKYKYKWREIFNIYIDFKLNLNSHFTKKTLFDFLNHFNTLKISLNKKHQSFFDSFIDLNFKLITFQSYQNLNSIATTKILKKFNKNIEINPSNIAPLVKVSTELINPYTMEQIISTNIVTILPQVDDYLCPICFQLAYKPIRLSCSHFFCLRCMIKLQRNNEPKCPICREQNVLLADETNIDEELIEIMKKEFPKELKEKKKQNGKEITDDAIMDMYGKNPKCVIV